MHRMFSSSRPAQPIHEVTSTVRPVSHPDCQTEMMHAFYIFFYTYSCIFLQSARRIAADSRSVAFDCRPLTARQR